MVYFNNVFLWCFMILVMGIIYLEIFCCIFVIVYVIFDFFFWDFNIGE